jgi:hypothetical protein
MAGRFPLALDFNEKRYAAANEIEQSGKRQDWRSAEAMLQAGQLSRLDFRDEAVESDEPVKRLVVKDDRQATGGRPYIAFDCVAFGDGGFKSGTGIFNDPSVRVM